MAALQLKPSVGLLGSSKSTFRGITTAFKSLSISQNAVRPQPLLVQGVWLDAVGSAGSWLHGVCMRVHCHARWRLPVAVGGTWGTLA